MIPSNRWGWVEGAANVCALLHQRGATLPVGAVIALDLAERAGALVGAYDPAVAGSDPRRCQVSVSVLRRDLAPEDLAALERALTPVLGPPAHDPHRVHLRWTRALPVTAPAVEH